MQVKKHIPNGFDYTPRCSDPSCAGRLVKKWISKETAVYAWNRRAVGWIRVTDLLPEDQEEVLVCTRSKNGNRNIDKGYWLGDRWVHRGTAEVTHWMPLPELPEEQDA